MGASEKHGNGLRGIQRATVVLRLLAERPMRPADITRELDLPWSTVYRTISRLADDGLLQRDNDSGEYSIGPLTWFLAAAYLNEHPVLRVARAHLELTLSEIPGLLKLCERVGPFSVNLFTNQDPHQKMRRQLSDQYRLPLHCASFGHVLLAYEDDDFRSTYLSRPLASLTPRTMTDPNELQAVLQTVRDRGYAVTYGDVQIGVGSIAAPIFDASGGVIAAVSAVLPQSTLTSVGVEDEQTSIVRSLAWTISNSLGWEPSTFSSWPGSTDDGVGS